MTESGNPPATPQAEQGTGAQAQEKAKDVAGQAQEKAQETAQKAQGVLREQIDQRSQQAGEQIGSTAGDLRSVGEELRKQGKDTPAKLADQAAEKAERVGSYLSEADADRLLSDAEDFGRRQPLAVLAGGVAVGILAARFLKASSNSRYRSRVESSGQTRELQAQTVPHPQTVQQPPPAPPESAGTPERIPAPVGSTP
jgi:hypothetical protein